MSNKNFISVTEDAYKLLVSTETKDKFANNAMVKVHMKDEDIVKKLKNYQMNDEDKKIRIIKPIFEQDGNKVIDISVLIEVKDNVAIWNR